MNAVAKAVEVRGPEKIFKKIHSEAVSPALGMRTLDALWSSGRHTQATEESFHE